MNERSFVFWKASVPSDLTNPQSVRAACLVGVRGENDPFGQVVGVLGDERLTQRLHALGCRFDDEQAFRIVVHLALPRVDGADGVEDVDARGARGDKAAGECLGVFRGTGRQRNAHGFRDPFSLEVMAVLYLKRNPFEWLYERTSQPLAEYVLDEVAKTLEQAARAFPPHIEEWESESTRARWDAVLSQPSGPLPRHVLRLSLRLYRWELERDVERIDRYLEGGHYAEYGEFNPLEVDTALFLWRYWVDQTLAFKEYAQEKFTWRQLLGIWERLQTALVD